MPPFFCMTVSAVEQLQAMASKRQYKEAAAQLEVSHGVHLFYSLSVLIQMVYFLASWVAVQS